MAKKDESLFEGLMESLNQAAEIASGKHVAGAIINEYFIKPAPKFNASKVKKIRQKVGFTQEMFARFCEVSLSTVRNWEQGVNEPSGPVSRILQALEREPEMFLKTYEKADVLSLKTANG